MCHLQSFKLRNVALWQHPHVSLECVAEEGPPVPALIYSIQIVSSKYNTDSSPSAHAYDLRINDKRSNFIESPTLQVIPPSICGIFISSHRK